MVGFTLNKFFFSYNKDNRYFSKNYKTLSIKNNLLNIEVNELPVFLGINPLNSLLLIRSLGHLIFNTSTINNINLIECKVDSFCYYWFNTFLKFELTNINFFHDMSLIKYNKLNIQTFSVISCLFFYSSLLVNTTHQFDISSVSSIFSGSTWVERELSEFNSIFFIGLKDSRRLLSDYLSNNYSDDTYKTSSYSTLLQDLL